MITLTVNVPNIAQVLAAGFTHVQLLKSNTQTAAGPYTLVNGSATALVPNQTAYSILDAVGDYGDWYESQLLNQPQSSTSSASFPEPGYLTDLCNGARDLLGVTTAEVNDAQITGFAILPVALSACRSRLATFDTVIAGGGDLGAAALGALSFYVAALLTNRLAQAVMEQEKFRDYSYMRNKQLDWAATRAGLLEQYEILISRAAGETTATTVGLMVPGLKLAGPTSGGYDTSGGLSPFDPDGGFAVIDPNLP
jgi:hypothetical protein